MKDSEINRINGSIITTIGWLGRLSAAELAMQHVLKDLAPTLTPEQREIIARYPKYRRDENEKALLAYEKLDPRGAAEIDLAFPLEPPKE